MDSVTADLEVGMPMFSSIDSRKSKNTEKVQYYKVSAEKPSVKDFNSRYLEFGMWPEMSVKR